jgi:hypothetical protein
MQKAIGSEPTSPLNKTRVSKDRGSTPICTVRKAIIATPHIGTGEPGNWSLEIRSIRNGKTSSKNFSDNPGWKLALATIDLPGPSQERIYFLSMTVFSCS